MVLKLRQDAFDAVLARDMSFYDEFSSGKIVSRVTSDTQDFSNVVTLTLNLMSQVLIVVIVVGAAGVYQPAAGADGAGDRAGGDRHRPGLPPHRPATPPPRRGACWRRSTPTCRRAITGIGVAKNFRQEQRIYDEFKPVNAQTYRLSLRQGLTFSSIFPILGTVAGIGTALIVYFGGMSVIGGSVSRRDLYLFVEGINLFWFPLISIASFWSQFQLGLAASERVFALIDAEPRVVQLDDQDAASDWHGRIEFRSVDFRYTDKEQVLEDFDLTIQARRDAGAGRAHRRGQVQPGQAGGALLRVPGRRSC